MEMENKKELSFEATIGEVKLHNSKIDENVWVDLAFRVAGGAGVEAAMALHRAKNKLVTVKFEIDE